MKIVVKPKNIYNLNKMKANAFIFGMKDFSVNVTLAIDIKTLASLVKKLKDKEIFVSIDKNIFDKDIEKLKQLLIYCTFNIKRRIKVKNTFDLESKFFCYKL